MSNQGPSRSDDGQRRRPRGDELLGPDQPTRPFDDNNRLPSLYGPSMMPVSSQEYDPVVAQDEPVGPSVSSRPNAKFAIGKFNQFLYWLLMVIEVWLFLRLLMKLLVASPTNPFAMLLYGSSDPLLLPFDKILPTLVFGTGTGNHPALELSTLVAMLVYALVFSALVRFLNLLVSSPRS